VLIFDKICSIIRSGARGPVAEASFYTTTLIEKHQEKFIFILALFSERPAPADRR
jgi:hypothetical protein